MGMTRARGLGPGLATFGIFGTLLFATSAPADQWYAEPSLSLRGFYDDNVRLSARDSRSTAGARLSASVESGRRTEVSKIGLSAKLMSWQYTDTSDLNETDLYLGLKSGYQLGRSRLGLDAAFDYDSTTTSEVATSGFVQLQKRRERFFVNPSWKYILSPRANLEASLSYEDVSYEDSDVIPLFDYSFATVGLTLNYALTERAQVLGRITYDEYDADTVKTESDSYGFQAGLSYRLTETMLLTGFAGVRQTRAETPVLFGTQDTENSGPIFEIELKKSYDKGELEVGVSRAVLPSSTGTLLDTTSIHFDWDYRMRPKWKLVLSAEGYRNRTPEGEGSIHDRDYLSLSPAVRHQLSKSLAVDMGYRYRWQEYKEGAGDASSNAVYLSVQYRMARQNLNKWSVLGE